MPGGYGTDESLPWGSSGDSYTTLPRPFDNTTQTFDVGNYDIDQLYNEFTPNYGNLPDTYKGPLKNNPKFVGEPIHNTPFNINRNAPNLKWIQEPMDSGTHPFEKSYSGKTRGYFPRYVPTDPSEYSGDPDGIIMHMDQLKDMGEMDYVGTLDTIWDNEDLDIQIEGSHHYPHVLDYHDYLNTLPVGQLQGIESLIEAIKLNSARNKKWWAQSDV